MGEWVAMVCDKSKQMGGCVLNDQTFAWMSMLCQKGVKVGYDEKDKIQTCCDGFSQK